MRIRNLLSVCFGVVLMLAPGRADAQVFGLVVESREAMPLAGARVSVDRDDDGEIDIEAITNALGMYRLETPEDWDDDTLPVRVTASGYDPTTVDVALEDDPVRQDFVLDPPAGPPNVDIELDVHCVISNSTLPGTEVMLMYWDVDDPGAPPAAVETFTTGPLGRVNLLDRPAGFYRFSFHKPGWLPMAWPEGPPIQVNTNQSGMVGLEPVDTPIRVQVETPDDAAITDAAVEVIGLDLTTDEDSMPPRTLRLATPNRSGRVVFDDLPPVPYRVRVTKPGFLPAETIMRPDADGMLPEGYVQLRLDQRTQIELRVTSALNFPETLRRAAFELRGVEGTATEGVVRRVGGNRVLDRLDVENGRVLTRIGSLIPGQYRIIFAHHQFMLRTPEGAPARLPFNRVAFVFRPHSEVVEVAQAETAVVTVNLTAAPAQVSGTILAEEAVRAVPDSDAVARPLAPVADQLIEFMPDPDLVALGVEPITARTDANGDYDVELPPGNYGIRVPRAGYFAGHLQVAYARPSGVTALEGRAWPYVRWPFEEPIETHSPINRALDLTNLEPIIINPVLRRPEVDVTVDVQYFPAVFNANHLPFGHYEFAGGTRIDPNLERTALLFSPQLRVEGEPPAARCNPADTHTCIGLLAGAYRVTVDHPQLRFTEAQSGEDEVRIELSAPPLPGDPPAAAPPAGSTQVGRRHFTMHATWRDGPPQVPMARPQVDGLLFDQNAQEYRFTNVGVIFADDRMPGLLRPINRLNPPEIPTNIGHLHINCPNELGWYQIPFTGEPITVRCGGPLSTATAEQAPPYLQMLPVDVAVVALNDNRPVPRVPVTLPGGVIIQHGQPAQLTQSFASDDVQPPPGWNGRCGLEIKSIMPIRGAVRCTLDRATALTGRVVNARTGEGISLASLRFVDALGEPLNVRWQDGAIGTSADGDFEATSVAPLTDLWVEVIEPGFLPWRRAVQLSGAMPDLRDLRIELTPLPAPMVMAEIDRVGAFLPGVLKSGDSRGFNADNAKASLTATVSIEAQALPIMSQLVPVGGMAEAPFQRADRIAEVHVIDPRVFETGLAGPSRLLEVPDGPTLLNARDVLAQIRGTDNVPGIGVRMWTATRTDNGWQAQIPLWTLPAGPFAPWVLVITDQGAVAWVRVSMPDGREPLRGAQLPRWTAEMLNTIGTLANANVGLQVADLLPAGPLRVGEEFEGGILVDDNGYLDYRYWIGVTFQEGAAAPNKGLLGLAGGQIGLTATGRVEFASAGERGEITVSGTGGLGTSELASTGAITPGLARRIPGNLVTFIRPQLDVAASLDIAQRIGAEGDPERYMLRRRVAGSIRSGLRVNLEPVFVFIPGVGPALARLKGLGLECTMRFTLALGGVFVSTMRTGYEPMFQATEDRPRIGGFLGPDEGVRQPPDSFLFGSDVALEFRTPGRLIEASGGIQIGPPEGRPMGPEARGLEVQFATDSDAPYVRRVRGAVSAIARVGFNIAGRSLGRSFQFDLLGIDWQSGTAPFMSLTPATETTTIVTPSTAPVPQWVGEDGVLVDAYYPASNRASAADGAVVYVQTDPATGRMQVRFADGAEAGETELLADTEGIIDVALITLANGHKLAAWIEFAAADLGNPYAQTTIGYVRFDGTEWSAPQRLTDAGGYAVELRGAASTDAAMLTWLVGPDALATERNLMAVWWTGNDFTAPTTIEANAPIAQTALVGATDGYTLVRLRTDGALHAFSIAEMEVEQTDELAVDATDFALAVDAEGDRWVIFDRRDGALMLSIETDAWSAPVQTVPGEGATELTALTVDIEGEIALLVAWYSAADKQIRYAFIDAAGGVLDGPHPLDAARTGRRFALSLIPGDAPDAGELRLIHAIGDRQRLVSYLLSFEGDPVVPPPPGDLPDGGIMDGGLFDGGMPDAGLGGFDGGAGPGGAGGNGGTADAGLPDGGAPSPGNDDDGGCSQSNSPCGPIGFACLLILVVLRRRR